jgi:RNA polymerase sigma factor (sigma-70 family)
MKSGIAIVLSGLPVEKLTEAQEQELASKATDESREVLVLHTLREAFVYARTCCRQALPDDEVISLCYTALVNAARGFKPHWQRFFPYAKAFVRGQINREWEKKNVVRRQTGQEALLSSDAVDSDGGGSYEVISRLDRRDSVNCNGGPDIQVKSKIFSVPEYHGDELEAVFTREMMEILRPIMAEKLTKQEQTVIEMAYFQSLNFQEVANLLGVSRAAIQAAHVAAINKLRKALRTSRKVV